VRARRAVLVVALAACHAATTVSPARGPLTRAERTQYTETSHYADVIAFLDSLPVRRESLGTTTEGRVIPYVIVSRAASSPEDAHAKGVPVVYVQANIHAGEVEGKEALLALVRDLLRAQGPGILDSVLIIAVPIYNADGNEKFAAQAVNRTEQNGPELVGQRANGQGLDLNRDYVKAEAPETRASLVAFNRWDPDVFVDLHTTDGSFHGYALTYAPSLAPGADPYARDSLLPELRHRMKAREGFATFDYGNFEGDPVAWKTYDDRPRFGTNYYGLRGRVAILSEAYSHDPFERRVKATYAFVREILSLVAEHKAMVMRHAFVTPVPVRGEMTHVPIVEPVVREPLLKTGDSSLTQPGVPRGERRSGKFDSAAMPVYDRFVSSLTRTVPAAYFIPPQDTAVVRLLQLHGLRVDREVGQPTGAEAFVIDSVVHSAQPFQGHRTTRLVGHWEPIRFGGGLGYVVSTRQPLGTLAVYLLEPESDDGLVTWNVLDWTLHAGTMYPIMRLTSNAP
jgi:hypothetical protein